MQRTLAWLFALLVALGSVTASPGFATGWAAPEAAAGVGRLWQTQLGTTLLGHALQSQKTPAETLQADSQAADLVGVERLSPPLRSFSFVQRRVSPERHSAAMLVAPSPSGGYPPAGELIPLAPTALIVAIGLRWARPLRAPPVLAPPALSI
jgi:hypothetical protein